ncbi:MAG: oligosaccharide flippase family protein [Deltaproteobacteria bacterium]|nr:oligosaccharide flippase family protein [Deltaproteobacteria bacterium]
MESTFKPALLLGSGRVLAFAATFFIPIVLVRVFDQAEFGTYKQIFLIFFTLYGLVQFGMAESLFYFLPLAPKKGGRYVLNAILALAAAGLVFLGLLEISREKVASLLSNADLARHMTLLGIYLLLMAISAVLEIVMISRKRYLWATFSYAVSDFLRAVFLIVPVVLMRHMDWLLIGAVAFAAVRLGATLLYVRYEFSGEMKPDPSLFRQQLAYALPFQMSVLLAILESNFHSYTVSYNFDPATFAVYDVGCLQIPLVEFLALSVSNVLMVRMGEELRDGRQGNALALWHDVTRKLALVFFPLLALVLVSAEDVIVFLFTESYRASVPVFMVWSVTILFAAFQTDGVLRVYAQNRFLLVLNALKLVLVAALTYWFISLFGLPGAALVAVFTLFVDKALALVRMRTLLRSPLSRLLPWKSLVAILAVAGVAGVVALVVKSQLVIPTLPLLLATGMVYTVSYVALIYGFGLLSEEERFAATSWLQKWAFLRSRAGDVTELSPDPTKNNEPIRQAQS